MCALLKILSMRLLTFDPGIAQVGYVGFVVDEVTLVQILPPGTSHSLPSIISQYHHTRTIDTFAISVPTNSNSIP